MGSGPRSPEEPRPRLGRLRPGRAVADRLPSAVAGGLLRVAPVLGRPLGLLRALTGGIPVGRGGEHRPSPPRLWWAAPWRRSAAEPEPMVSGSASRTGWAAPGRSGRASSVGPPVVTAMERAEKPAFMSNGRPLRMNAGAGPTGSVRLRPSPTPATGTTRGNVLRRSVPGVSGRAWHRRQRSRPVRGGGPPPWSKPPAARSRVIRRCCRGGRRPASCAWSLCCGVRWACSGTRVAGARRRPPPGRTEASPSSPPLGAEAAWCGGSPGAGRPQSNRLEPRSASPGSSKPSGPVSSR